MNKLPKILAVSSIGGHWIQLLRIIRPLEKEFTVDYMCTHIKCATMVEGKKFYKIEDFSRWNAYKIPIALFKDIRIIRKCKPDIVITTGAAPGLICLLAAKFCGIKTIWIDSIANVEHLSASGKVAIKLADRVYTQWPDLAAKNIIYKGNIFG